MRPSVATVDDPFAIIYNPAGLAFTKHNESIFRGRISDASLQNDFAMYMQNGHSGIGYEYDSYAETKKQTYSRTWNMLKALAFGYSYSFDNLKIFKGRHDIGLMYRPNSNLSIGANFDNIISVENDDSYLNTGIALQDDSGRIGASLDFSYLTDNITNNKVSKYATVFIEPIKGLRLTGFSDFTQESSEYGLSIGFFLRHFGIETHNYSKNSSDYTISARISENAYRSLINSLNFKKDQEKYVRMKLKGLFIEEPEIKKSLFDLSGLLPFGSILKYGKQLRKFIDKIDKLSNDDSIDGIIIELGQVKGGLTKLAEIHDALKRFHDTGKKVIVYSKSGLDNRGVLLTAMADEIFVHELGIVDFRGLNFEISFYRTLLDSLSIVPEVWRVSPYKTAGDILLNKDMSSEMRENFTQLFSSIYDEFVSKIASAKGWSNAETRQKIDNGPYLLSSQAIEAGLITGTKYPDEFEEYVKNINKKNVKFVDFDKIDKSPDYKYGWQPNLRKNKIAVIYAVGGIIPGKSKRSPSGSTLMGDKTIAKAIKSAREDENVKAIVLRIDSGGGSALASDVIWRQVLRTTETDTKNIKPIIASMSGVAASGGYYIACQADSIIASPMSITGSIGVIAIRPNFSQLKERIGINTENIKLGENADFATGSRLATTEESEKIMEYINDIYIKFKDRVVKGRDKIKNEKTLDEIALGRVWSGNDATGVGLIDKVGGYYDAIEAAKNAAKINDYQIVEIPIYKNKSIFNFGTKINEQDLFPKQIRESFDILNIINIIEHDDYQMLFPVQIDIN